jgi:hypothetical protein
MSNNRKQPWFSQRRFGYGSGLPVRWQGWAVLAVYALLIYLAVQFLGALLKMILIVGATLVLAAICYQRTEGGWRWRWGDKP